jgi:hypothetical protein
MATRPVTQANLQLVMTSHNMYAPHEFEEQRVGEGIDLPAIAVGLLGRQVAGSHKTILSNLT